MRPPLTRKVSLCYTPVASTKDAAASTTKALSSAGALSSAAPAKNAVRKDELKALKKLSALLQVGKEDQAAAGKGMRPPQKNKKTTFIKSGRLGCVPDMTKHIATSAEKKKSLNSTLFPEEGPPWMGSTLGWEQAGLSASGRFRTGFRLVSDQCRMSDPLRSPCHDVTVSPPHPQSM